MSIYKRGNVYWYNFIFDGEKYQESTKQENAKVARDMEATKRAELVKERDERAKVAAQIGADKLERCAECEKLHDARFSIVGSVKNQFFCGETCRADWTKRHTRVPSLAEFLTERVEKWLRAKFEQSSPKTWKWYKFGIDTITDYAPLADKKLDAITVEHIAGFAAHLQASKVSRGITPKAKKIKEEKRGKWQTSSINAVLRALRRALNLAEEWGVVSKAPKVTLLRGEKHRERVLTRDEEIKYLSAATEPLASLATILLDTGLRPEECFRLRWEDISFDSGQYGLLRVTHGKTAAARRVIPFTPRVREILLNRYEAAKKPVEGWVWPAETRSGHFEHDTIRVQHTNAIKRSKVRAFVPYSFRHTFLTRLGESGIDVWTLARIAGHSSITMSARYVHPGNDAVVAAMAKLPSAEQKQLSA